MAVQGVTIHGLDAVQNPATELPGAELEVDIRLGPVAGGRLSKKATVEQIAALIGADLPTNSAKSGQKFYRYRTRAEADAPGADGGAVLEEQDYTKLCTFATFVVERWRDNPADLSEQPRFEQGLWVYDGTPGAKKGYRDGSFSGDMVGLTPILLSEFLAPVVTINVPLLDPAKTDNVAGVTVHYSINSQERLFITANDGGPFAAPTDEGGTADWIPYAQQVPPTALSQAYDLSYAGYVASRYPDAVVAGRLYLIKGPWNGGPADQVVSVEGVAGGFATSGTLLAGGVLSTVAVDVAAGTTAAQGSGGTFPTSSVLWVNGGGQSEPGQRGNPNRPFRTLPDAHAAAIAGDTIIVLPGGGATDSLGRRCYAESAFITKNVTIHCVPGVVHSGLVNLGYFGQGTPYRIVWKGGIALGTFAVIRQSNGASYAQVDDLRLEGIAQLVIVGGGSSGNYRDTVDVRRLVTRTKAGAPVPIVLSSRNDYQQGQLVILTDTDAETVSGPVLSWGADDGASSGPPSQFVLRGTGRFVRGDAGEAFEVRPTVPNGTIALPGAVILDERAAGGVGAGGSTVFTATYTAPAAGAQAIPQAGATAFWGVGIRTAGGKLTTLDYNTGYTFSAGSLQILASVGVGAGEVVNYSYATGAVSGPGAPGGGTVKSVNGIGPDAAGNVNVAAGGGSRAFTNAMEDDAAKAFFATAPPYFRTSELEYTQTGGASTTTATDSQRTGEVLKINVTGARQPGQVGWRVRQGGGQAAGPWLFNVNAYTAQAREYVINGDFSSDFTYNANTGWNSTGGWTWTGGAAHGDNAGFLYQNIMNLVAGASYRVSVTVANLSAGGSVQVVTNSGSIGFQITTNGTQEVVFTAADVQEGFNLKGGGASTFDVTLVSIKAA